LLTYWISINLTAEVVVSMLNIVNVYDCDKIDEIAHNGNGILKKVRAYYDGDFQTPIDFIDYVIVPPGTTIGIHTHRNNEELYFIVKGKGKMYLQDDERPVKEGDVIVNPVGGKHGLTNDSENDMMIFIIQVSLEKRS
jgi:mannose-6-phosphate isomerase-like protein (cupin superfamily)